MVATTRSPTLAPARSSERDLERAARNVRERRLLDEAEADIAAGLVIADEDVDAWLDAFVRGDPLPMPDGSITPGVK